MHELGGTYWEKGWEWDGKQQRHCHFSLINVTLCGSPGAQGGAGAIPGAVAHNPALLYEGESC